jgi:molybdate transport system regulatory protein
VSSRLAPDQTGQGPSLGLDGLLWVTARGASLGGPGRMALLRAVHEHGSITQAARAFGMSYKAAWDAVNTMNARAGEPLVARTTGGRGGGSTRLTPRGQRLVQRYAQIEAVHRRFLARLDDDSLDLEREFSLLDVLNVRTSARNQFLCTVRAVEAAEGAVNEQVALALPGGACVVATVTAHSRRALGLRPGVAAIALVKASAVSLQAAAAPAARPKARPRRTPPGLNRLAATVLRTEPGGGEVQVSLALAGGAAGAAQPDAHATLVAVVSQGCATALALAPGQGVIACFDPASVTLAVLA